MKSGDVVRAMTIGGEDWPSKQIIGTLEIFYVESLDCMKYMVDGISVNPDSIVAHDGQED